MAQGRFRATGTLGLNPLDSDKPYVRKAKTKNGGDYASFNCSIIAAKNNRMFVELFGMKQDVIKTMDTDNNKVEIAWADRNDPEVVKTIANYKKTVINLTTDRETRKEFVSSYDAVLYLAENEELLKKGTFVVTGQVSKDVYNGKIRDRFQVNNIYAVDPDQVKLGLKITTDFVWERDGIDIADFAEDRKVVVNGYVSSYVDKDTGNQFFPQQIVLDCSKIDLENEKHVALMKAKMLELGVEWDGSKPKVSLKKNQYYEIPVEISYSNGAEEVEFSEKDLTDKQRMWIELGEKTLEDFRPKGSSFGNRVTVYKLTGYDIRGDYVDGRVEIDDISDNIFVVPENEKAEEVFAGMNPPVEDAKAEDPDDLFN